jgi:hypothetical protein
MSNRMSTRRFLFGGKKIPPSLTLTATTTAINQTVGVTITPTGGTCVITWGDGSANTTVPNGHLVESTHVYATAGVWSISISNPGLITRFSSASPYISNFDSAQLANNVMISFTFGAPGMINNRVNSADMVKWRPTTFFLANSTSGTFTINTAHMVDWRPTEWKFYTNSTGTYTINSADMAAWNPTTFFMYYPGAGTYRMVSSDMAGWTNLSSLNFRNMPAGGTYTLNTSDFVDCRPTSAFYWHTMSGGTGTAGTSVFRNWVGVTDINIAGNSLSQVSVDAVLADIYAGRAGYTHATPVLSIGGNNVAPSGTYAEENPPTSGKGMAYELVNDPGAEGFYKWAITFTA